MKILHLTAMSPLSPNSGVPAVLKCLTDEQNKIIGVETHVLALCSPVDMIDSDCFDSLGDGKIGEYLDLFCPDMAIFHSFYHIEYATAERALRKRGIPFFIEPHGAFGHSAMKKGCLKKYVADRTVFRALFKNAAGFIYTNVAESQDSIYQPKQSTVIPNGIIESIAIESNSKKPASFKEPIFYFLGRYDIHHKGLDFLLDALKILDDKGEKITIRLYGIGTDEQVAFVRDRIAAFKNVDARDMGTIYGDKKKEALEDANILVLTSRYEGSPMTILDGFCYGNPCLVTSGTNVADEAVEHQVGWKTDLDAGAIAESILRAKREYITDGIGYYQRCKSYVLSNYTWQKMAALSITEYKRMLKQDEG